ncbi:acetate uptake transporter [Acetobacter sp. LMG 32666]|uniref:acetate uptake transporter n=1 Tax=Acetobacter sp. LMG 32666 TaxID=2959295 RepID=UPI0030C83682
MAQTDFALPPLRANPAPLGLMGFGMTTILLNLHNAGFVPMGSAILAMGLLFGGIAQIIAGILEYGVGNTFGMTAFISYGAFWLTLVALIAMPHTGIVPASSPALVGSYLLLWGLFTLVMFLGTLRATRAHQVIFGTLVILFVLLGLGDLLGEPGLTVIAGYEGLLCGLSAVYLAAAEILEAQFKCHVLPVGPYTPTAA